MSGITAHTLPVRIRQEAQRLGQKRALCSCLNTKKGNCYCFAGQFLYMARRLGYNAYVVSGGVGRKDSDHAWVMICENGVPYIYDVELEWGYRAGRYGHAEYNMYKMPLNKTVFSYQFP
ncbi:MAG: transglutaminase domain-containing protein [Faecalibacterium prausnitzii]